MINIFHFLERLKNINPLLTVLIAYLIGQGSFFLLLAILLATGQHDFAGWLSYSITYASFGFQVADLGAVTVLAKYFHDGEVSNVRLMLTARSIFGAILGIVLSMIGFAASKTFHLQACILLLPLYFFYMGLSKTFMFEVQHNFHYQAIVLALQWISALFGAVIDYYYTHTEGALTLLFPAIIHSIASKIIVKNINELKFNFFEIILSLVMFRRIIGPGINGLFGQVWGRLVVTFIVDYYGKGIVASYTLARGLVTALTMVLSNMIRVSFVTNSGRSKVNFKDIEFLPKNIRKLLAVVVALCGFSQLFVLILSGHVIIDDKYKFILIASNLMLMLPAWIIYAGVNTQFYYCTNSLRQQLIFEVVSAIFMVISFFICIDKSYITAVVLSDVVKYVVCIFIVYCYRSSLLKNVHK